MLPKEFEERFKKVEENIHYLAGGLATTSVLTLLLKHLQHKSLPESIAKWIELFDPVLLGMDVLIAAMLILGIALHAFAIDKPNRVMRRLARDKVISQHIRKWLNEFAYNAEANHVRFCTEECIENLTRMNYEAFKASPFGIELEKLAERNQDWVRKNNRIFMLILDPIAEDENVIGYSSMLPLTSEGIKCYLNGGLKDADIPPALIATDVHETAAILIFAIHLRPEYSINDTTTSRNYSLFFLERVKHHVRTLFPVPNGADFPPMYVQTELQSLKGRLKDYGFESTKKQSADGFEILVLRHPFHVM